MSLVAVLIFALGLLMGLWHVERGPLGGPRPAAVPSPTAKIRPSPTAPGERLPTGEVRIGSAVLVPRSLELAELYVETGIPPGDAEQIAGAIEGDVAQVQRTYGRRFAMRPQIYVFANRAAYNRGVEAILGEEKPTLATTHAAGVALSSRGLVAVDWTEIGIEDPLTSFRHELVHVMIAHIAQPTAKNPVPSWLNEGSARLEEFTVAGTEWQQVRQRTAAASMVAARNYFALGSLRGSEGWGGRIGPVATVAYFESAAAFELLRQEIGVAGVTRILDLIGQGEPFDDAFLKVAGVAASAFEDSAPGRFKSLTAELPGIVTHMDGELLRVRVFGFMPRSEVSFDVVGQSSKARNTDYKKVTVDEIGIWETSLGPGWPADTYAITVAGVPASSGTAGEPVAVTASAVRPPR